MKKTTLSRTIVLILLALMFISCTAIHHSKKSRKKTINYGSINIRKYKKPKIIQLRGYDCPSYRNFMIKKSKHQIALKHKHSNKRKRR